MDMSDKLKPLLLIVGGIQLATGLLMAIDPGTFFEEIGPYGVQNDHYIRDAATFTLALGMVLTVAAFRPRWRVAAIAGALFQFALHAINHLVDIGEADPERLGPTNFVLLALGAALLGWMFVAAIRAEEGR